MTSLRRVGVLYGGNDTTRIFGDGVVSWYLARALARAGYDVWRASSTERRVDWTKVLTTPTDMVIAVGVPEWQVPTVLWSRARYVVHWWLSRLFYDEHALAESQFHAVATTVSALTASLERVGMVSRTIELAGPREFLTARPVEAYRSNAVYVGCYPHKSVEQLEMILKPASEMGLAIWGYGWEASPYAEWYRGVLPLEDVGAVYASVDIVLALTEQRQAMMGMVNNRVFEAVATGAGVLADESPALRHHEVGRYVHVVKSGHEVRDILGDEVEVRALRSVAVVGREAVRSRHTYDHRVGEFVELYQTLCRNDGA